MQVRGTAAIVVAKTDLKNNGSNAINCFSIASATSIAKLIHSPTEVAVARPTAPSGSNNTNFKTVGQPLRIVLTGSKFGPGLYDIIISLGKEEVIKRLTNKKLI